jgi:uncharacterized protein (TIGR02246 family)
MTESLSAADRTTLGSIVTRLERAWNAGDGIAWAEPFAPDADFVNIRAEHFRGRETIAQGHAAIFRTIYAGSQNAFTIDSMRLLRPDVALVHVAAVLDAPTGPLAGRHTALFSFVCTREAAGWQIGSFHNTLTPPATPSR